MACCALEKESAVLSRVQFEVLRSRAYKGDAAQRVTAGVFLRAGDQEKVEFELQEKGYLDEQGSITHLGISVLSPYKVDNAIILAAGMATRLAPLSFEKPKALFEVKGEVLIERAIRQLQEAGIDDIIVVVGYMKEALFYLEDEFNVHVLVNDEYSARNNNSSLWRAKELLANTYVLSSDQYYSENIFSLYNYTSYSSAIRVEGDTKEQVLTIDESNRIVGIERGGRDALIALGPAYLDREFSSKFIRNLAAEYDLPQTAGKLWEEIYAEHLDELPMEARVFEPDVISEFDYLTDLVSFDGDFFSNVDSRILDNICSTLGCSRNDIKDVAPIKAGLSNLSTLFSVNGAKYIYRHPGAGTEETINREAETSALIIADEIGLDDTYIYENPQEGWKISRYIEGCTEFDYKDRNQVKEAMGLLRRLHNSGRTVPWHFDFFEDGIKLIELLEGLNYPLPRGFEALTDRVASINSLMAAETGMPVLCHNDFYGPNLLVGPDHMRLIDWEYAAMGDPACDIGNFVAQGSNYSVEEALELLPLYYGRLATEVEERHCLGAVGLVGWYWYVWAMYKEAVGNPVGEWLYIWYRAAKGYITAAEERYGIRVKGRDGR